MTDWLMRRNECRLGAMLLGEADSEGLEDHNDCREFSADILYSVGALNRVDGTSGHQAANLQASGSSIKRCFVTPGKN